MGEDEHLEAAYEERYEATDIDEDGDDPRPCNDCGKPCYWDEGIFDWQHVDPEAPDCFLIRRKDQ